MNKIYLDLKTNRSDICDGQTERIVFVQIARSHELSRNISNRKPSKRISTERPAQSRLLFFFCVFLGPFVFRTVNRVEINYRARAPDEIPSDGVGGASVVVFVGIPGRL